MSEDKLITDNLQLVSINVLIRSILNTKVLQGSVATRVRCDGIFNDQFIILSLLSSRVKLFWKICQYLPKLWAVKYRFVFLRNTVYIYLPCLLPLFVEVLTSMLEFQPELNT